MSSGWEGIKRQKTYLANWLFGNVVHASIARSETCGAGTLESSLILVVGPCMGFVCLHNCSSFFLGL